MTPELQNQIRQISGKIETEYKKKLKLNRNSVYAINLVTSLQSSVDLTVQEAKKSGVRFGCKKGCSHCCNLRVEALAPEVFYIAKKIKEKYKDEAFKKLVEKIQSFSIKAKGLSQMQHIIDCPLLADGACSIYEFRPAMCRKYNSLDGAKCEDPYAQIPEDLNVTFKSNAKIHGFQLAYEHNKLTASPHELGQALYLALTDSTAEARWFKGQKVFAPLPEA